MIKHVVQLDFADFASLPASGEDNVIYQTLDDGVFYMFENGEYKTVLGGGGSITGSGTTNYVTKWTSSTALGNSLIQDNGTTTSIGASPIADSLLYVTTSTLAYSIQGYNTVNEGKGVYGRGSGTDAIGVHGLANGNGENIGVKASAKGGSANYSIHLEDGTEGVGKFLKSITASGKANWSTISASDISGGVVTATNGQANYLSKFTSSSNITISQIYDNGSSLGIGITPAINSSGYVFIQTSSKAIGLSVTNLNTTENYGIGLSLACAGARSTTNNIGLNVDAYGNTNSNIGVYSNATQSSTLNIGGIFIATGGTANYSVKLQDGTQGVNKFLRSVDVNGSSNWSYINYPAQIMSSDMTTGITASANAKSYWIAPTNGTITDIFAYLHTAQTSGAVFTVDIKKNGTSIFSTLITWTNGQRPSNNTDVISTTSFTAGDLFEVIVTQVGDGTAKGLLVTINYNAI